ncbi:hypothetical protein M426DRAFT_193108 [Hypoxylon sp. CI-4A]|nr:hypothetical protein M426DRAFT_193108 [Hypoxylon sp. CI-4A]
MGSLSVLDRGPGTAEWVYLQIFPALKTGSTAATTSWTCFRNIGNIWGIAIPSAIFNSYSNYASAITDLRVRRYLLHGDACSSATKAFVERFTRAPSKVFLTGLAFVISFIRILAVPLLNWQCIETFSCLLRTAP